MAEAVFPEARLSARKIQENALEVFNTRKHSGEGTKGSSGIYNLLELYWVTS